MSMPTDDIKDDELIAVVLPRRDYHRLRKLLDDQEVNEGIQKAVKRWGAVFLATLTAVATLVGLYNFFKDFK